MTTSQQQRPQKPQSYDSTGIQYHTIPQFTFTDGTTLHNIKVAFRSYNDDLAQTNGTVLIPTCFSGRINNTLTFTGTGTGDQSTNGALSNHHVVVAAMLGNGESSSPSNTDSFPGLNDLRYEDVIRAHYHLLTEGLNITKPLEAVIGFSMGGQQAYHWAVMYPDFVKRIVGICTSARTSPHNYAFLEGPIAALERSADYVSWKQRQNQKDTTSDSNDSTETSPQNPISGLEGFSRAYAAWLTSAEWFREGHWRQPQTCTSINQWLEARSQSTHDWNPDDLLVTARMWQKGDIGKTSRGTKTQLGWFWNEVLESESDQNQNQTQDQTRSHDKNLIEALSQIKCPVLLMPCRTDQYFRPSENEFEIRYLPDARLEVIESVWGHIAGGGACAEDTVFMNERIGEFLR